MESSGRKISVEYFVTGLPQGYEKVGGGGVDMGALKYTSHQKRTN